MFSSRTDRTARETDRTADGTDRAVQETDGTAPPAGRVSPGGTDLEAVVSDDAEEGDDGVGDGEEAQRRLHVARALLQEEVHQALVLVLVPSILHSGAFRLAPRALEHPRTLEHPGAFKVLLTWGRVRHLGGARDRQ